MVVHDDALLTKNEEELKQSVEALAWSAELHEKDLKRNYLKLMSVLHELRHRLEDFERERDMVQEGNLHYSCESSIQFCDDLIEKATRQIEEYRQHTQTSLPKVKGCLFSPSCKELSGHEVSDDNTPSLK